MAKSESPPKPAAGKRAPVATRLSTPFWAAAGAGRLVLQRDPASGATQFFPRPVNLVGSAPNEWVDCDGQGQLLSFTECHMAARGFEGELPYVLGLVQLAGGARVLAQVVAGRADTLVVGQAVRLRWLPRDAGPPLYAFEPMPTQEMPS